jgi:hypothetical protein
LTPTAFAECQFRQKEFNGARFLLGRQDTGEFAHLDRNSGRG